MYTLLRKLSQVLTIYCIEFVYMFYALERVWAHKISTGSVHNIRETYFPNIDCSHRDRLQLWNTKMEQSCILQRNAQTVRTFT